MFTTISKRPATRKPRMTRTLTPAKIAAPTGEKRLYTPVAPVADAVRVAMVYPAPYNVAMSSLGYLSLVARLDQNPQVDVRRVDESTWRHTPVHDVELMGYSFSFELDILAILRSLEAMGIPLYAKDRDDSHPLVFGGGPVVMSNPEPYAGFFDFFLIGEGEELLDDVVREFKNLRGLNRAEQLHRLAAEVPGVYVPSMYEVAYAGLNGPVAAITPKYDDIPPVVEKRSLTSAALSDNVASSPILSPDAVFANMFMVEVMRGCAHRCRFCLASYTALPARGPAMQPVIERIEEGLKHTDKIGLVGALIADHPDFPELCDYLHGRMNIRPDLAVSAASLRVDTLTPQIAETFKRGKQKQITLAVESGSDRLKRRINKNIKNEQVMAAAGIVAESGLEGLKLYGMVGLPDETETDVDALADLMADLRKENKGLKLHLGVSSFVPKAGTPFQWQPRLTTKDVEKRFKRLRKQLAKVCDIRPQSARWDYFQAVLSRGDRRLAPFIERFWRLGGSLGSMNRAVKELRKEDNAAFPGLDWYALRERPEDEILPWDVISLGVPKNILWKEGQPPPGFSLE